MRFTLISGTIKNLKISGCYENTLFTPQQSDLVGLGAIGAAAIGEGLSSTMLASASTNAELEMEYFTCTIKDEEISGRFYKVDFENGQTIHFAVDQDYGRKEVHAALDPMRRIVWTLPYRTKGHIAQRNSNIKGSITTSIAAAIFGFLLGFYSGDDERTLCLTSAKMMAFSGFLMTLIVSYRVCRKVYRRSLDATFAFEALGFADPANINLPKGHRSAEKRYAVETGEAEEHDKPWRFRFDEQHLKKI